jgi:hypothetical protein
MQSTFVDHNNNTTQSNTTYVQQINSFSFNNSPNFNNLNNNFNHHNHHHHSYMPNAPPPSLLMYKFDYNSQLLFDNFQNLIEKKGLVIPNKTGMINNDLNPNNTTTTTVTNSLDKEILLNELDDLARIKLEDIDELNSSSSPSLNNTSNNNSSASMNIFQMTNNFNSNHRNSMSESSSASVTTPQNVHQPINTTSSQRSRNNSLVNALITFCTSSSKK